MLDFLYFCSVMLVKTQALVLKTVKFGDNKFIIDLFSEELGKLSIMTVISSSPRARFNRSLFQHLMILDVEIDYRQNKTLHSLKSATMAYAYKTMLVDPKKMCIIMFVAELLAAVTKNEPKNIPLFNYIKASLQWLDEKEGSFSNFHLVFMMRLVKFIGFTPNIADYEAGDYFDLRSGIFCSGLPHHADVLMPNDAAKVKTMLRMNYENMHLFVMSRADRNRMVDVLLKYYAIHVPNFSEIKTLDILHSLFD